ncbi:MAG: GNAT family N-acetyltransferase [Gammaproteobacteria bacterium]|nr:GNAT family N-acetyltransferase [Gammaproteobacteria bacterium]
MSIEIIKIDYSNRQHAADLSFLMNAYASDSMAGGKPLSDYVIKNLAFELSKLDHAFSLITYVNDKPAGLVNCFEAFSTFNCKPLVNIHDFFVLQAYRQAGLSQLMLEKVTDIARTKNCCKLTLEVLAGNNAARSAYQKYGFTAYELDKATGVALFWHKDIT